MPKKPYCVSSLYRAWFALAALLCLQLANTTHAKDPAPDVKAKTALADYVQTPDESFGWVKRSEGTLGAVRYVELTLTSQTWQGIVWKHQLFVLRPESIAKGAQGLLLVAGGSWKDELAAPPTGEAKIPREAMLLAMVATQIEAPVAVLLHVPQQPILGGMKEDAIISYTFEQYLKTQDATWPLLLPMVKSVVRAMDTIQQFSQAEWQLDVKNFTVTGASKRGWTTWLTAAVDPRVNAIAPMVFDVLNMRPQMDHQLATWGKYSEQIHDYSERGIQEQMQSATGNNLRAIVDPFNYRGQIPQSKLIMLGTNDRYWPLDALNLYWDELKGKKNVLYVPNNGHGLNDISRIVGSLVALHRDAAGDKPLPKLSWKHISQPGSLGLEILSDVVPKAVSLWTATSATKDFRDAKWQSVPLAADNQRFESSQVTPEQGFLAFFGEAMYDTAGLPFYLSTNVKILGKEGPSQNQPADSLPSKN